VTEGGSHSQVPVCPAHCLVGLDVGTTTVTGLIWDVEGGQVLHLAQRRNDAALGDVLPTRAEQDPHRLRVLALEVLAELAASRQPVGGIALTGQKHGLLCTDGEGQPLTPLISWQDQRTVEPLPGGFTTLDQLHARLLDLDWRENGCRIEAGYGAATLFWLVQRGELPAATCRVHAIADWLACQLTDRPPVTDPTLAASWGVYNLLDGDWNDAVLHRLGLEARYFPQVRPSGERLGRLASHVARQVGLADGIPVFNALGDTQASFLGSVALLPRSSAGRALTADRFPAEQFVFLNLGTGGQILWVVPAFELPANGMETRPLPHNRYLKVGASLCGGAAYAWLNRTVRAWLAEFGVESDEEVVYERLSALAGECDGSAGLRVQTTFLGVRGDPQVRSGAIEGITLDNLKLGPLARATLLGIVDELHGLYLAHGGEACGHTQVVASGGGVYQNPVLPHLIEERFGLPVCVSRQRETAAVGAATWAARHSALQP
jgi:sedoheptulokinase